MNAKKIFAAVIAALMAVSTMAVASFAEADGTDETTEEITAAQSDDEATAETSDEATDETTAEDAGDTSASEEDTSLVGDPGAAAPDKNQPNTGVADIAVVAALAAVSAGVVVIAKKRK